MSIVYVTNNKRAHTASSNSNGSTVTPAALATAPGGGAAAALGAAVALEKENFPPPCKKRNSLQLLCCGSKGQLSAATPRRKYNVWYEHQSKHVTELCLPRTKGFATQGVVTSVSRNDEGQTRPTDTATEAHNGAEVSNLNSQMEERCSTYGTHKNINEWFTALKELFLEMGFARLTTEEEVAGGHKEELYFPPEQL
eukprot:jgi/Psemu1/17756/gm1.17756_g